MRRKLGVCRAALPSAVAIGAAMLVFAPGASAAIAPGALKCSLPEYNPTKYALQASPTPQTITCTITGASDVSGSTVPVIIKSSNLGNTTVMGSVSGTTITFTFTAPRNGCNTSIVAYGSNGNNTNNSWITPGGTSAAGFAFVDGSGNVIACGSTPTNWFYLGYADNHFQHEAGLQGLPWTGMPAATTIFVGCGGYPAGGVPAPPDACEKIPTGFPNAGQNMYDAGAIRIDNTTGSAMSVTGASVTIGTCTYNPWGSTMNISLAPGSSLVLTQTGGPKPCNTNEVGPYNFDTSEASFSCTVNNGLIPAIKLTINGQQTTINDTGQILNTGGVDPGECGLREYTPWTVVL